MMNNTSFKFIIKDYFKLSTGATAFVGLMEPSDYPLITADNFVVKIKTDSGKSYIFKKKVKIYFLEIIHLIIINLDRFRPVIMWMNI